MCLVRGPTIGKVVATIVKAPLGVTVEGNYSGTTEIIKPTAFTTTGLVNGETLTALSKFTVQYREVSRNDDNYVTELFSAGGTAVLSNYFLTQVTNKLVGDTQNMVKIKALADVVVDTPKWASQPTKSIDIATPQSTASSPTSVARCCGARSGGCSACCGNCSADGSGRSSPAPVAAAACCGICSTGWHLLLRLLRHRPKCCTRCCRAHCCSTGGSDGCSTRCGDDANAAAENTESSSSTTSVASATARPAASVPPQPWAHRRAPPMSACLS
jgi:hypothetical protein